MSKLRSANSLYRRLPPEEQIRQNILKTVSSQCQLFPDEHNIDRLAGVISASVHNWLLIRDPKRKVNLTSKVTDEREKAVLQRALEIVGLTRDKITGRVAEEVKLDSKWMSQ